MLWTGYLWFLLVPNLKVFKHVAHEKQQRYAGVTNFPCLISQVAGFTVLNQDTWGNQGGQTPYSHSHLPSQGPGLRCLLLEATGTEG